MPLTRALLLLGIWILLGAATLTEEQRYQQAIQYFNQGDGAVARRAFEDFQKAFPKSRWSLAIELRLADLEPNANQALSRYQSVVDKAAESEWGQDARWGLAVTLFVLGEYQKAIPAFSRINAQSGQRVGQALYLTGLSHLALKQAERARNAFQAVLDHHGKSKWVAPALAGLGEAELALKETSHALKTFDRYLREFPQGGLVPQVMELKAQALAKQGQGEASVSVLHELVTKYTASYEAEKAKLRLAESKDKFTVQVGAFTKPEYAQKLVNRLRQKGYNAYILVGRQRQDVFNQVRIGSYTKRAFADKIGEKLSQAEDLPYIVLPYVEPETPGLQ